MGDGKVMGDRVTTESAETRLYRFVGSVGLDVRVLEGRLQKVTLQKVGGLCPSVAAQLWSHKSCCTNDSIGRIKTDKALLGKTLSPRPTQ